MGKVTVHPRTGHEGPEGEQMYSPKVPSTSALDGGGCPPRPAALPLGKTHYPLYRRVGGPQGRSGRVRKISLPTVFDPRTVQPVASRCIIPAPYAPWVLPRTDTDNNAVGILIALEDNGRVSLCMRHDEVAY